jgi:ABC-type nitrate/sulfonate/bicarbonate transport system substrate-binding protein
MMVVVVMNRLACRLSPERSAACPAPARRRPVAGLRGAVALMTLWVTSVGAQADGPLRLSGSPWIADAPTKVALAAGAFDESVEVLASNSGRESLDQLLAGETDLALMATTPLALHACGLRPGERGAETVQPVVLASLALSNNTHYVFADGRTGIERARDLAGRRVGVMFDTSAHFGWHQFVRHAGLAASGVELVDLDIRRLPDALLSGRVDAAVIWSPWERPVIERWGDRARRFRIRAVDSVNWLLVGRRGVVERRRDAVAGVLRAYGRAIEMLNAEPARARELYAGIAGAPLPDADDPTVGVIWQLALDWSLLANLQANLEWCAQRKGGAADRVGVAQLIEPAPLEALDPSAVLLPAGLFSARSGDDP